MTVLSVSAGNTIFDSRTEANDKLGSLLIKGIEKAGHYCATKQIVPDDIHQVGAQLCQWIVDPQIQIVLITGGADVTGRKGTRETIRPLLDKEISEFGEISRVLSFD